MKYQVRPSRQFQDQQNAMKIGQKSFDAYMELSFLLEEVFQQRIELVTLESLSPYIGPHILKEVEYASLAA